MTAMQGVIVVLEGEAGEAFARLQDEMKAEFGVRQLIRGHIPHITLHLAERYDITGLDAVVKSIARSETPFVVRTVGIAFFPGEALTLYWPVVRSARLALLQRTIAQEASLTVREGASEFCVPETWVPHVTLAGDALTPDLVGRMTPWLLKGSAALEIAVTHLSVAEEKDAGTRIISAHKLEG